MKRFATFTLALAILGTASVGLVQAALSPDTVDKMKSDAPEVLDVEILSVDPGKPADPEKHGSITVAYKAKVLDVVKSQSGLKAGDTITIRSYRIRTDLKNKEEAAKALVELVGPKQPDLLPKEWKGKAYLKSPNAEGQFGIAVYGHSFESAE